MVAEWGEIARTFGHVVNPAYVSMATGAAAATALSAAAWSIPALNQLLVPRVKRKWLKDSLLMESVADDERTVICRDGTVSRTLKLSGRDYGAVTAAEAQGYRRLRKQWFESVREIDAPVNIKVIQRRRRAAIDASRAHASDPVVNAILGKWYRPFGRAHVNDCHLVVSIPPGTTRGRHFLDEAVNSVTTHLMQFGPQELMLTENDSEGMVKKGSPLLTFWSQLLNPTRKDVEVAPRRTGLLDALVATPIEFDLKRGLIWFKDGTRSRWVAAVGFKEMADTLHEEIMQDVMALDIEMTAEHLIFVNRPDSARKELELVERKNLKAFLSRKKKLQFQAAKEAIDDTGDDGQALLFYQTTIFVEGNSPAEAEEAAEKIRTKVAQHQMHTIREHTALYPAWFSLFPGCDAVQVGRKYRPFSSNISSFVTFETSPEGMERSVWGPPIMTFRTAAGTPYRFHFHKNEGKEPLGHVLLQAPPESGKTTLMEMLETGALAANPRLAIFNFDRHYGMFVWTKAVGGKYVSVQMGGGTDEAPGGGCDLNPFQLDLRKNSNREFLKHFLALMAGFVPPMDGVVRGQGDLIDPKSAEAIAKAVETLSKFDRKDRSLRVIYDAFFKDTPIYEALYKWVDPLQNGRIFNAANDNFEVGDSRVYTFDVTTIWNDPHVAMLFMFYASHRIRGWSEATGAPSLIFVDETAPLLKNAPFRALLAEWLQEFRKKHGVVVMAFQRATGFREYGLSELMRSTIANAILYRNENAKEADYEEWDLTPRQFQAVKGFASGARRLGRPVLFVKPGVHSVLADIDNRALEEWRAVFRSGTDAVLDVQAAIAATLNDDGTENRERWLARYLGVNNLNELLEAA